MKKVHWADSQLGDFPYHGIRRRASDQTPQDLPSAIFVIGWLVVMTLAVIGVLHLVHVL